MCSGLPWPRADAWGLEVTHVKSVLVLFALSFAVCAQTPPAEITGAVSDSTNAVVSGATVTITNLGTNLQRVLKTNTSGIYDAPGLPPGVYSVRITMPGFKTEVRTSLEVQVDQVARLNFTLQVGAVSETVEVAAAAAACPTADPSPQNPL